MSKSMTDNEITAINNVGELVYVLVNGETYAKRIEGVMIMESLSLMLVGEYYVDTEQIGKTIFFNENGMEEAKREGKSLTRLKKQLLI